MSRRSFPMTPMIIGAVFPTIDPDEFFSWDAYGEFHQHGRFEEALAHVREAHRQNEIERERRRVADHLKRFDVPGDGRERR